MDLSKLDLLKEGNFAKIYTKGEVAYKTGELSSKEILRGQFELLSEINDPHFVCVYDWFEDEERCGFSMEKIPLPTIDQIFKKIPSKKDDFKKIENIITSILDSLSVLHSKGIICGDLKPTHIFVDKNNNVKLIDPGYDPDIITPIYAPPEALTDSPTFSSDIYSVGVILYEILTGEKAFTGSLSQIIEKKLKKELPPPDAKSPSIPPEINLLVQRMTAKDLKNRLKNIEEVRRELALGAPFKDKKPSFAPIFSGREKELKEFDSSLKAFPESHIFRINGEIGSGKTALLNQFKIKSLCSGINVIEVTPGELYRFLNENSSLDEAIILLLDDISSSSELNGIIKENSIKIRTNPVIIVISSNEKSSDIEEFSDITNTFTLKPLNKKEIEFIIDKNFPGLNNKKELISFATEQSGGNPSLLNQTIEIFIKGGVIEKKRNKIFFKQDKATSTALPKSLEEHLKIQVENLPKEEKELLKILSVFQEKIPLDSVALLKLKNPNILINSFISQNILKKDKKGIKFKNDWVRELLYKKLSKKDKENIYRKIKKKIISSEVLYILQKDLGMKKEYRESLIKVSKKKIQEREYLDAIKFLKEALVIKENRIDSIILARVVEMAGNINEALSLYYELLSEDRKNPFYLLKIGSLEDRIGNLKKAEKYFRRAANFAKGKVKAQAIYWLAYFLIRNGKLDEPSRLISEYKKDERELPMRLKFIEGRILCDKGKFVRALKIVEEELNKNLSYEMQRHFATLGGIAKLKSEKYQGAIKYFQKCIDMAKEENDILHEATFIGYKGRCMIGLDKYKEALEELEEAISLYKKIKLGWLEDELLMEVALVYLCMGYWEKLQERVEDIKERYGRLSSLLKEKLFYSRLYRGEWAEVEKIRKELEKEELGNSYLFDDAVGIFFAFKGEWKKAEKRFKEFEEKIRGNLGAVRTNACRLSEVTFEQNKKEEAIALLKPYIEKLESIQSGFQKGRLLSSWGLVNEDIKSINVAIELFSKIGLPFYTAQTRLKKTRVLMAKNKIEAAIEEVKKAEKVFKELKAGYFLDKTNELFIECAKRTSGRIGYIHTYEEISKLLSSIDSERRFDEALAVLTGFFNAERGAIILKEEEKDIIISSYNIDGVTLEDARRISSTVTKKATKGEAIIVGNAVEDSRFFNMGSIKRNKIRSILCVPIISEEKIYGALYLDSTIKKDIFLPSDKEFLQSIGRILGILFSKGDLLYRMKEEVQQLKRMTSPPDSFHSIIGISESMQDIYKTIEEIAETEVNVLITGETGTGKELIARTIHKLSKRNSRAFITVDCGSLSEPLLQSELFGHRKGSFTGAVKDKEGICEVANGGTLFLDEVGDAPASIQSGLLRVTDRGEIRRIGETELREVDIRIISATNKDLEQEVAIKNFRKDFFYRLNQAEINIPPLRERKEDISLMLNHYLKIFADKKEKEVRNFERDAIEILENYPFPGNVRELKNIVELALIKTKGKNISKDDLLDKIIRESLINSKNYEKESLKVVLNSFEKSLLIDSLKRNDWNITKTAEDLDISRRSLQLKIKKLDIVFEK